MAIGSIQMMNYAVSNRASFSDTYMKSVDRAGKAGRVNSVNPVQYPNASATEKSAQPDSTAAYKRSQVAAQGLNQIAAKFSSVNVGYDQSGAAAAYSMAGQTLDLIG